MQHAHAMTIWQALILGLIQGLTEFLPVSSSGHLLIVQQLLTLPSDTPEMILFDLVVHVATLAAVAIVFARPLTRYLTTLFREWTSLGRTPASRSPSRPATRILLLGIAASIPTALIGVAIKKATIADKPLDQVLFGAPWVAALGLLLTGAILWMSGRVPHPRRGWRQFSFAGSVGVGIAQGLAICPGISRSGATICVALLLGLRRRWAAQFSFFIAAPAILGAALLQAREVSEALAGTANPTGPTLIDYLLSPAMLVAFVAALLSGWAALVVLLAAVRRARLDWFAWYVWALGGLVLALSVAGWFASPAGARP